MESKKEGKDQESIQSSTTHDPGKTGEGQDDMETTDRERPSIPKRATTSDQV